MIFFLGYCLLKAELMKKNCQLLLIVGRLQYSITQVVANTRIYVLLEENTILIGATRVKIFNYWEVCWALLNRK